MHLLAINSAPPPGADKVNTLMGWAGWVFTTVCILGFITVGITMALRHRRGEGGEHMSHLGWVMCGCIVGAASGSIVGVLTG